MADKLSISWPRIFAEGAAIVVSILLAFWIQAWWEGRQQSAGELAVLRSLHEDINDKLALFRWDRTFNEAVLSSAALLLRESQKSESDLDPETVDFHIANIWFYNNSDQYTGGAMSALMEGGELSSITSTELRIELQSLWSALRRMDNIYFLDQNFHHSTLTPYLIENVNTAQLIATVEYMPGHQGEPEAAFIYPDFELGPKRDHTSLLASESFQNIVIAKIDRLMDIRNVAYVGIEDQLVRVVGLIENELASIGETI